MAVTSLKCPYCSKANMTFSIRMCNGRKGVSGEPPYVVETYATCHGCFKGIVGTVGVLLPNVETDLTKVPGALSNYPHYIVMGGRWLPSPPVPDVPDRLPEAVSRAFSEAEELRLAGFRGPAGNAYRRALEAAIKIVDPELTGSLYTRIETLSKTTRLTPSMRDFAHRIRTLGNEASHETPVVGDDEIDDLATFTKLFLLYQFTLPEMIPVKPTEPKQQ